MSAQYNPIHPEVQLNFRRAKSAGLELWDTITGGMHFCKVLALAFIVIVLCGIVAAGLTNLIFYCFPGILQEVSEENASTLDSNNNSSNQTIIDENTYWPENAKKTILTILDEHETSNNRDTANALANELKNIFKKTSLMVIVFDGTFNKKFYEISGIESQCITVLNHGNRNRNVIVYRSLRIGESTEEQRNQLQKDMKLYQRTNISLWSDRETFLKLIQNNPIRNSGLIAMIREDAIVEVRFNSNGGEAAGFSKEIVVRGSHLSYQTFLLVVGYN